MKLRNKKTGEDGRLMMCHDYDEYPFFIEIGTIKIYYHNFADMVKAGWDCIKIPSEPLIKDEKIRKAVRTWAEAVGANSAFVEKASYNNNRFVLTDEFAEIHFRINTPREIESFKRYTIAELCGEEEE